MALKIAVLKNSLKTNKSPYVVRSDSSSSSWRGAAPRSPRSKSGAMWLYKEELQKQLVAGRPGPCSSYSCTEGALPRSGRRSNVLTHILRIGLSWRRYLSLG